MSYYLLPNIIFIFAVLGVVFIILRHLPEAAEKLKNANQEPAADKRLLEMGLPAQAISKIRVNLSFGLKKAWHFVLEAKDLRPQAITGYKMKRLFSKQPIQVQSSKPIVIHEVKNEKYYLDLIKLQPKNLSHYDGLGKFYLEQDNLEDGRDIYLYLANHEPSNPDYQARLAYCYYKTKNFKKSAEHYKKSLALDSTQPNRYYNLSLALKSAGSRKEASTAIHKALELEPENLKFQETLKQIERV